MIVERAGQAVVEGAGALRYDLESVREIRRIAVPAENSSGDAGGAYRPLGIAYGGGRQLGCLIGSEPALQPGLHQSWFGLLGQDHDDLGPFDHRAAGFT